MDNDSQILEDLCQRINQQITGIITNKRLQLSDMASLIKICMEAIDFYSAYKLQPLSGEDKAKLAEKLILFCLDDLAKQDKINMDLKNELETGIKLLAPIIFELVVLADKGGFNFINLSKKCFSKNCCTGNCQGKCTKCVIS